MSNRPRTLFPTTITVGTVVTYCHGDYRYTVTAIDRTRATVTLASKVGAPPAVTVPIELVTVHA
jgi:uncharacterized protein YqiB (DUF1249 family)